MSDSNAFPTAAFDPPSDAADPTTTRTFGAGADATLAVGAAPPAVPGYEIVRELGRGGMGVVYLARQQKLNREVALKMVLAGGHASAKDLARFMTEAQALAFIQHPSVTQLYEVAEHDGRPYFALEYCPGGSLAAKLDGTPLPASEAAGLLAKLARAVEAAHAHGIVHRDLKPGNVLLAGDGTPKVTDFGLARRIGEDSALTATGAVLGSPSYMAPEQAAGNPEAIGPGTDVYGLGAILYECLTGRPPFKAATPLETVGQVLKDEPVSPRVLQPKLPRDIETICLKCLQKDPAKRYPTAAALADDLDRFLDGRPIQARPVPWWERAWKAAKRRPAVAASGLAAVVAVAMVVAVVLVKNAELERERDAARQAEIAANEERKLATLAKEAAEKSEAVAAAQRQKAQQRLEKAIEVVERLFNRVGTEKWVRNPELVAERRQLLEDAVAFYESFKDEDAKDPLVRRETGRAFFRIAGVYLLLGEYPKASAALARAEALQAGLTSEFPDDPRYANDLAQTLLFIGHAAASTGEFEAATKAYPRAVELARAAVGRRADDDGFQRTLVECLCSQGYVFLFNGAAGDKAAEQHRETVAQAKRLIHPKASFASRVVAAYAYVAANSPITFWASGKDGENYKIGAELLAAIPPDPNAPAQYRDLYDLTAVMVKFNAGIRFLQSPPRTPDEVKRMAEEAPRQLREAADGIDRLLAVYPKAFQYRMYKLQILMTETSLLRGGKSDDFRRRAAELFAVEDAILRDTPKMDFVRMMTYALRAEDLVWRARDGDIARLDEQAAELLKPAIGRNTGDGRYNVACAYAVAVGKVTDDRMERYAVTAVELLNKLIGEGYFAVPSRVAHLDKDDDLDALRDRDDFKAFLAKARAAGKK